MKTFNKPKFTKIVYADLTVIDDLILKSTTDIIQRLTTKLDDDIAMVTRITVWTTTRWKIMDDIDRN